MMYHAKPTFVEYGRAISLLWSAGDRADLANLSKTVGNSAVLSLEKLDRVLERIIRPSAWNASSLVEMGEDDEPVVRMPGVQLEFVYDTFPARAGNLELWLNPTPGCERDFIYDVRKTKLLRVDKFASACNRLIKADSAREPTAEDTDVVVAAGNVFNFIVELIAKSCEVEMVNKLHMYVDYDTGILASCDLR